MIKRKGITKSKNEEQSSTSALGKHQLILHNDDVNSFDFVINSLVGICNHTKEQAEQCTLITHYKGYCEIRVGSKDYLEPMKNSLVVYGLSATIE